MKRHESIVPLSRDHHFGLLFCWKIRQGIKRQVPTERIQPYVNHFWENHLQQHFEQEETILFAALQHSLVEQAVSEHQQIKRLVESIRNEPGPSDQLLTLADLIDNHIRFEERVLFPFMEKELSMEKLTELGIQLQQEHQSCDNDNYADEFWVN